MPKKCEKKNLLTASKIAELLGVSKTEVQKTIKEANIKPDEVKCGCSYFSEESVEKIKKLLKK
jgi:predicted transcriptional regulator